jgi:hypothetical protein
MVIPTPQGSQEGRHVLLARVLEPLHALPGQFGEVAVEVPSVRRQGVARQPTLDGKVIQV